jgi:hypothetical protein
LFSSGTGRPAFRPFFEAGPSFRTTGNLNSNPSHLGISAGGGVDYRFQQLNIEPILRYTRWTVDPRDHGIQARADQIELLVGFSHASSSDAHPFGKRLLAGVVLGTNLLGDYNTPSTTSTNVLTGNQTTFLSRSGPRSLLAGPTAEFRANDNFSLEVDALYRPIRERDTTTGIFSGQTYAQSGDGSFVRWQFPVLTKYNMPVSGRMPRPFVEAGPSFRIPDSVTHFGLTAGAGVSAHLGTINIAPAARYTRWQADPQGRVKSNEATPMLGFTF